MSEIWMDVDAALSEVPVNLVALIDDTDFKSREESVTFDQSGLDLLWNFVTTAGAFTQTAVTPTDTAGDYDWVNQGNGYYTIEIPATGGASANNDTEGFGFFSGFATGVLPWRGPVIGFRAAALNNALIDGGDVLDVSLTEIGGVAQSATDLKDFADAGYDPGTNLITGLSATGLDAIASTALGMVEIAKAIWDRVLTGATHNIATSAGRRLRGIQEFQGYEGGAVWIDTVSGTAGTVDFENGTVENPVDTIADANTIAASLSFERFHVLPGSSITFAATQTNQVFEGNNWTLALGAQSIIGTTIMGASVSGVASGAGTKQVFKDCIMGATSHVKGTHIINCGLSGTQTMVEAGDFFFDQCHSAVANSGTVTIDFGAALNSSNLNVRHHSGGWTVENMGAGTGTYQATFEGNGQIIWAASCSATSNASIRGNWKITDNASGAVTEILDDNQVGVDAILVDTADMQPKLGTPAGASISADILVIDNFVDGIESTLGTPAGASMSADILVIDNFVDGIESTLGAAGAGLTDLGGMSTAMKAEIFAAAMQTQMTEGYAANGVAPTAEEAQFAIHQMLMQFGIVTTTLTVRKLDNTTTAFVVTLDDGTSPTDAKRV